MKKRIQGKSILKYIISLFLIFQFLILFSLEIVPKEKSENSNILSGIKTKPIDFKIPETKITTLSNGIQIYSRKSTEFPIIFYKFVFPVGKNSPELSTEALQVWSQYLEMSGSSLQPGQKFRSRLEDLGASFKVQVTDFRTTIHVSCISKDFEEVSSLVKELIHDPNWNPEIFQERKEKILEDISRRNDSHQSIAFRKAKEIVLGKFKIAKSISAKAVSEVKIEDIQKIHAEILKLEQKIILVNGDFLEKKFEEHIQTLFSTNEKSNLKPSEINGNSIRAQFEKQSSKTVFVEKTGNQSVVILAGLLPDHNHPDYFPIQLLNYIIASGGFNGYFMKEIRTKRGLSYTSSAQAVWEKNSSYIVFYSLTKSESTKEVLQLMNSLLSNDTIQKIQKEELEYAKAAIINQFVFLADDDQKILATSLLMREHDLGPEYLKTYRDKIQKVRLEDLRRVGAKYFDPKNLRAMIVGNKSLFDEKTDVLFQPEDELNP